MLKRLLPLGTLLLLLVVVAACGGNQETATSAPPAATVAPAPSATPAGESGSPATATVVSTTAATPEPSPAVEASPTVELAADVKRAVDAVSTLNSYRTLTRYEFSEKTVTGTLSSGTFEMRVEYTKTPVESQRFVMTSTEASGVGDGNTPQQIEMVRIGSKTWMSMGDNNWLQTTVTETTPFQSAGLLMDAPELLVSVNNARSLGTDTINGIASRHYTFDQQQLPFFSTGDLDEAKGEFWIAIDGGFISKYTLEAQGSNVELSNNQKGQGTLSLTYEMSDVNQPITIEPPQAAASGPAGFAAGEFPLPADAETQMSSQQFATYLTSQSVADVAKLYNDKLPALGWTASPGAGFSSGDLASLAFEKNGNKLSITITKNSDTGKTQILVSSEAAQ